MNETDVGQYKNLNPMNTRVLIGNPIDKKRMKRVLHYFHENASQLAD